MSDIKAGTPDYHTFPLSTGKKRKGLLDIWLAFVTENERPLNALRSWVMFTEGRGAANYQLLLSANGVSVVYKRERHHRFCKRYFDLGNEVTPTKYKGPRLS